MFLSIEYGSLNRSGYVEVLNIFPCLRRGMNCAKSSFLTRINYASAKKEGVHFLYICI